MGFIKFIPTSKEKITQDITTTMDKEIQLWQELTMLRHIPTNGIYGKIVTAPYIDQAKVYYNDARLGSWKSAGLLYYYSFLNLAKALIVTKRGLSADYLKSTGVYHGLQANPQNPSRIIDFTLNIHPPSSNNKKNIFSLFYEKLTNKNWPFSSTINISINQVINSCSEISHELNKFYSTNRSQIPVQSLLRELENNIWFELIIPNNKLDLIQSSLGSAIDTIVPYGEMTSNDKSDWRLAYGRLNPTLNLYSLVRINSLTFTNENKQSQYKDLISRVKELFKDYLLLNPVYQDDNGLSFWYFEPKKIINGVELVWHPMLSNYLFAFVLSTVLRYHPHILYNDNQNSFLAQAWCNQSPISTLRYFLMNFTNPSLRMN